MKSFLTKVITSVLKKNILFSEVIFILPSKRAGVFLKHEIQKSVLKTTFAPTIFSVEEFVVSISNIQLATNTQLLFKFYETYKKLTPLKKTDDFYTFSKWALTALNDFNEIDRNAIDTKKLFSYLNAIQKIKDWSVTEETTLQKNYIQFFNKLEEYYTHFTKRLLKKNIGYQGLLFREALKKIDNYIKSTKKKHIFIGFNALNKAEEQIIQKILQHHNSEIYWDIDATFLEDSEHDAGFFIRQYLKNWSYFDKNPFLWKDNSFLGKKEINIVGIPKNVAQTTYTAKILTELHQKETLTSRKTAVILGNENLLTPMLHSIPNDVKQVNITMGLPLQKTPVASLFSSFFQLYLHQKSRGWYYKNVIDFLTHPYIQLLLNQHDENLAKILIEKIQHENWVHITPKQITSTSKKNTVLQLLFTKTPTTSKIIDNCLQIITVLKNVFESNHQKNDLEMAYLHPFHKIFNQLQELNQTYHSIENIQSLYEVYNQLLEQETLDFEGNPLEGLQLMGMLESRNLDFETVIITNVNEGILPAGKTNVSFIPFDVKKAFDLPTYKEKDAIYTYHFYRLLQRASTIYLLYNTESDVLEGGEKSRFLLQLLTENHPNHNIKQLLATPEVTHISHHLKTIKKDKDVLEKLKIIATEKGFSPTALTNYIRNPLDFYHQTILEIYPDDILEETIAANTLGSIIHNTLEILYKPFENAFLTTEIIDNMLKASVEIITDQFDKLYKNKSFYNGKNLIIYNVVIKYIDNFLQQEKQQLLEGNAIKILYIESSLKAKIDIPELDFSVYINGKIDRIDGKDGKLRIIDYKTGKVTANEVKISDWEELTTDYKFSKSFQLLTYTYLFYKNNMLQNPTEAGIISFKNLQNGFLSFSVAKENEITSTTLTNFETTLKKLILEIFNPKVAFIEKEV